MEARSLIHELDDTFPPFTPGPTDTIEHIMHRAGQRSVIEYIKHKLEED